MDKYEVKRKIGQGSFGSVHVAVERKTGKSFVVKEVVISKLSDSERLDVEREVQLLSTLQHQNIVTCIESFADNGAGSFFIVMEFCSGGDLYHFINRQRGLLLTESLVLEFFVQICHAVRFIHDRKILHRDIKSQNILLTPCPTSRNLSVVKLGDFGIARLMKGTHDYARTCVGTPYYLSPEIWENKPYNSKSDLWAVGCVLYEMLTLRHAFEAGCMKSLMLKILRGSYPPISAKYSYDVRNLVSALLRKKPSERPSLGAIFRKRFVAAAEEELERSWQHAQVQNVRMRKARSSSVSPKSHNIDLSPGLKKRAEPVPARPEPPPQSSSPSPRPVALAAERHNRRERLRHQQLLLAKRGRWRPAEMPTVSNSHGVAMWIDLSSARSADPGKQPIPTDTYTLIVPTITNAIMKSTMRRSPSDTFIDIIKSIVCSSDRSVAVLGEEPCFALGSHSKPLSSERSENPLTLDIEPREPHKYASDDDSDARAFEDEVDADCKPFGESQPSFLEEQRVRLKARLGVDKLLRVYRLVQTFEERGADDDVLDCSHLTAVLGPGNEALIDEIIQLVVADNNF